MSASRSLGRGRWLRELPAEGGRERRETVRIDVGTLRSTVYAAEHGQPPSQTALIVNFSATGALLESKQTWALGTRIVCRFSLPGVGEFAIESEVVRQLAPQFPSKFARTGVRFVTRAGTDSRLMGWVFREMARRRQGA